MYGQLGHGNTEKQSSPKPVKAVEGSTIYLLACGNFHTVSHGCSDLCFSLLFSFSSSPLSLLLSPPSLCLPPFPSHSFLPLFRLSFSLFSLQIFLHCVLFLVQVAVATDQKVFYWGKNLQRVVSACAPLWNAR